MLLNAKAILDLVEDDLLALISNGTEERREIEYKGKLELVPDKKRKDFLADVSSFANASGGHLIYGIVGEEGIPTSINPVAVTNWDALRLQLEEIVREGISPRLSFELVAIPVRPSGHVIVLRIPRSWSGPHMVTFQHNGKFHSRNSAGIYQLDVGDLRAAFTSGAQVGELIRAFRQNRLGAIVSGEIPVNMVESESKLVLHCCPYSSAVLGASVDIHLAHRDTSLIRPMGRTGFSPGFNFDGVIASADESFGGPTASYFQLFRDGKVECVDAVTIRPHPPFGKVIFGAPLAATCITALRRIFKLFRVLEIQPPAAVMISLLGVKSFTIGGADGSGYFGHKIDRDALFIVPGIAEAFEPSTAAQFLQPMFDSLWNSAGLPRCHLYGADGQPLHELQAHLHQFG